MYEKPMVPKPPSKPSELPAFDLRMVHFMAQIASKYMALPEDSLHLMDIHGIEQDMHRMAGALIHSSHTARQIDETVRGLEADRSHAYNHHYVTRRTKADDSYQQNLEDYRADKSYGKPERTPDGTIKAEAELEVQRQGWDRLIVRAKSIKKEFESLIENGQRYLEILKRSFDRAREERFRS